MAQDQSGELAERGLKAGSFLAKLVKYLGIPIVSGAASASDDVLGFVVQRLRERRNARHGRRYEDFVRILASRVDQVEDLVEEDLDPFEAILAAAIADEDEAKLPYYASCVGVCVAEKWDATTVRLICGAIKELCKVELEAFRAFVTAKSDLRGPELPGMVAGSNQSRNFLRLRLAAVGLMLGTGTIVHSSITPLGHKIAQILDHAEAR